jgi:hypothetical protein
MSSVRMMASVSSSEENHLRRRNTQAGKQSREEVVLY